MPDTTAVPTTAVPTGAVPTTRGLSAVLRLTGQSDLPVLALLRHRSASLVELVLVLDDEPVRFALDRALLTDGLTAASYDGAVHVSTTGQQVSIEVAGLECVLALQDVAELLVASYVASPTGSDAVVDLEGARGVHARA